MEAFVVLFKKRRSEANSLPTFNQCEIDDNKLSTTDNMWTIRIYYQNTLLIIRLYLF